MDRMSRQDCLDRAQRALEVAEANLEAIADLMDRSTVGFPVEVGLAHAEARTRLGRAWTDLAAKKGLMP